MHIGVFLLYVGVWVVVCEVIVMVCMVWRGLLEGGQRGSLVRVLCVSGWFGLGRVVERF